MLFRSKRLSPAPPAPQAPRQAGQQGRPAQPRAPRQGKVNHVTAESVAESANVVIGMFMVNSHPATVLFDTSATHLFITKSYVEQHSLFTTALKKCLLVSSQGGEILVRPRVSIPILLAPESV